MCIMIQVLLHVSPLTAIHNLYVHDISDILCFIVLVYVSLVPDFGGFNSVKSTYAFLCLMLDALVRVISHVMFTNQPIGCKNEWH